MINVKILKNDERRYAGFTVSGHAGYAREGEDIVCSAVSVLVINTVNALDKFTEDVFSVDSDNEEGIIDLRFDEDCELSDAAVLLVDTMVLGLTDVAQMHSAFIQLEIKEV